MYVYLLNLLYFSDISRIKHAFLLAAPTTWNQPPITTKSSETMDSFRTNLKTYMFEIAFPPYIFDDSKLQ